MAGLTSRYAPLGDILGSRLALGASPEPTGFSRLFATIMATRLFGGFATPMPQVSGCACCETEFPCLCGSGCRCFGNCPTNCPGDEEYCCNNCGCSGCTWCRDSICEQICGDCAECFGECFIEDLQCHCAP
jgi:hypothetical protein